MGFIFDKLLYKNIPENETGAHFSGARSQNIAGGLASGFDDGDLMYENGLKMLPNSPVRT